MLPGEGENFAAAFKSGSCTGGVAPILNNDEKREEQRQERMPRPTGTVYRALGLGLPAGQFSRTDRRESERIPLESVSTSRNNMFQSQWTVTQAMRVLPAKLRCRAVNIGITPLSYTVRRSTE